MKQLLTSAGFAAMLLLCVACPAQTLNLKDIQEQRLSLTTTGQPDEYKQDTISIIMLACDTTSYNGFMTTVYYVNPLARAEQERHYLNWIKGFAVREIRIEKRGANQNGDMYWINQDDKYFYNTKQYLDDEKHPLPKEIIVWQVVSK